MNLRIGEGLRFSGGVWGFGLCESFLKSCKLTQVDDLKGGGYVRRLCLLLHGLKRLANGPQEEWGLRVRSRVTSFKGLQAHGRLENLTVRRLGESGFCL